MKLLPARLRRLLSEGQTKCSSRRPRGHYAGLENRRTSDWRRRSGACDTAADGALLGEALRTGLVDADRLDRHTFDHSDSCSRLREAVVIPPVTDPRQEVSQKNGGVRGETAKTQSKKIDETAARDHGGTSGPNGEIGPSIVSEQARNIALYIAVGGGVGWYLTLQFAKAI